MEIVWSNNQVSHLIKLYKQHQELWDISNKYYKDKLKKNDALTDIAKELNLSQKEVETKLHILRSQFSREKKKVRFSKTGSGVEVVRSRWQWYDSLQFLLRGSTRTSDTMKIDDSSSTQSSNINSRLPTSPPTLPMPPLPQLNSKKRKSDDEAYDITPTAKNKMEELKTKDEFEIYGQYVASELKNVVNQRALIQAKFHINNILLQARMGNFDYSNFGGCHGCRTASTSTATQTTESQVNTETADVLHEISELEVKHIIN